MSVIEQVNQSICLLSSSIRKWK